MDDVLTNVLLQGGGGGSSQESYELAMYYMARHTALDSVEKRKKKGYLFIVGDETPYDFVSADEVSEWIGDKIEADIPTTTILAELQKSFEVFWLFPNGASNCDNKRVLDYLNKMFGQRFIKFNPNDICTTIAATIAVNEGRKPKEVIKELKEALGDAATDKAIAAIVDSIPPRLLDDDL